MRDKRKRDRAGRVIPEPVTYSDEPARIGVKATTVRVTRTHTPDAYDGRSASERRTVRPYSRRRLLQDAKPNTPRVTAVSAERIAEILALDPSATVRAVRKGTKYRADMVTYRVDPRTL